MYYVWDKDNNWVGVFHSEYIMTIVLGDISSYTVRKRYV